MQYPEFLKENGTIGFIAPSFGVNTEPYHTAFEAANTRLQTMGYRTCLGSNVYEGSGIGISNTPEKCGKELTDMYLAEDNDLLISVGGGELMCEDLDHIDFEALKAAKPKWFMGYSDNTNFSFLSPTLLDRAAFYGPCAGEFGMRVWHESVEDTFALITGRKLESRGYAMWQRDEDKNREDALSSYNCQEKTTVISRNWDKKPLSGRFIGGCLDILATLCGTRFDRVSAFTEHYASDGIIFFIEACDLNVFGIRRALWQLRHAGWFKHVKGFIIGRPLCFGENLMGLDQYSAVTGVLGDLNVPILMDCDIGHLDPAMTMINGGCGTVTSEGDNIRIRWELK